MAFDNARMAQGCGNNWCIITKGRSQRHEKAVGRIIDAAARRAHIQVWVRIYESLELVARSVICHLSHDCKDGKNG